MEYRKAIVEKCVLLGGICLLWLGCNESKQSKVEESDLEPVYTIRLEECLDNPKQMLLSEVADTIKYIALKTPSSIVVMAKNIKVSEEYRG